MAMKPPNHAPRERTEEYLLRMQGISKMFSGVHVLSDVCFDLRRGEAHVLAGENGAGKSTLIKILAGVYGDYTGTIELGGRKVRFRSPHDATAHGISVMYQEMSLIGPMSVADNILLGREEVRGGIWLDRQTQYKRANELLVEVGLTIDVLRPLEEYPPSIQQMIEIAKALAVHATIFVMDEPTSSLSHPEVERLFDIIRRLKARGCGVVYITHRLEEIYTIADRVTVLRDGKTVGTDSPGALSQSELIRWMVGRPITQQFPARSFRAGGQRLNVDHVSVLDQRNTSGPVVNDVSFDVRAGEILGVAGLQGSGKSELLNGLFGAYGGRAGGNIRIDGQPFDPRSPSHSIKRGLVLLTNERTATGLIGEMNIVHNTTIAALKSFSPGGWVRSARERRSAEAHLQLLRIRAASLEQEVSTLSGGNQQKVVLAKWLATRPAIFLLDEPTRGVDVGVKHEIYELMNQWTHDGCAVVLVTSELPELLAMSDRILVMCRGRLTARFSRSEATRENVIRAAMGGVV